MKIDIEILISKLNDTCDDFINIVRSYTYEDGMDINEFINHIIIKNLGDLHNDNKLEDCLVFITMDYIDRYGNSKRTKISFTNESLQSILDRSKPFKLSEDITNNLGYHYRLSAIESCVLDIDIEADDLFIKPIFISMEIKELFTLRNVAKSLNIYGKLKTLIFIANDINSDIKPMIPYTLILNNIEYNGKVKVDTLANFFEENMVSSEPVLEYLLDLLLDNVNFKVDE